MRALFIVSAFLFVVPFFAHGTSLHPDSYVLLEVKTFGGFVAAPFFGHENGVRIEADGKIKGFYRKSARDPLKETVLGNLSRFSLDLLKNKVSKLPKNAQIEFPDEPRCADAPTTTYTAKANLNIVFAIHDACVTGYLSNSSESQELKTLLDGLAVLNQLQ